MEDQPITTVESFEEYEKRQEFEPESFRPQADKKKIHSKNEFELCYMRHQYLRRVTFNPTATDMAPYTQIVTHQAKNTFYTYRNLFKLVGFELDDIISIAKIHLVSFLGLYKLDKLPKKYEEFIVMHNKKHSRDPNTDDVENKDRANLTHFMKQRMEDVVRVCRQKARNIKGMPVEEFYVYYGAKKPPKDTRDLLENHESFGFRKLDMGSFKSIKKKCGINNNDEPFKFAGYWYIAVPLEKRSLGLLDFSGAGLDPYDSIHNRNPEELLLGKIEEEEFERKKAEFQSQSAKRQEDRVRHFIRKNKGNPMFKEEIALAKKFLSDLRK
jgi:hypothetical protein